MNKSILFKILLISSCTFLTSLQWANADQQAGNYSNEEDVAAKQKFYQVNHDALEQIPLDGDNDGVLDRHDQCPNSPVDNKVGLYGCTKQLEIAAITEKVVTISLLVNFDNDNYNVDEKYFAEINRVANFLKQYPNVALIIEGHTSSQGSAEYNKKLSQQRANEIVNILTNKFAIDNKRLSAMGYGEEQLIDLADTIQAHAINRRIEGKVLTE